MSTILINYDLKTPGQNYDRLITHIKSHSGWCRVLASTWAVSTNKSAKTVRDECKAHVDPNDELYVVDVSGQPAAWFNLSNAVSEWLKKHH